MAGGISLIVATLMLRKKSKSIRISTTPSYSQRAWFAAMWPLALLAGLHAINSQVDLLMIGALGTIDQVGLYRVAVQGAALVVFTLHTVNLTVAPHIAQLHSANEIERLQKLVTSSARLALFGALPVAFIMVFFGKPVLQLIFGVDYVVGHAALAILTIGQLFNAAMGSVGLLLNMTGHERDTAKAVAVAVAINIPMNLVLIPVLGINGAALATSASLLVWNILLWRAVKRHLALSSTAFSFSISARRL
jgi:O-antigen/teichoic acid export membrane protein